MSSDTGSLRDVRHVVILMQENRSFDHYFGALRGVRGFDDSRALKLQGGQSVFVQPDPRRAGDDRLAPYRLDTTRYRIRYCDEPELTDASLPHDWETGHRAANGGRWDQWIAAKGPGCMGYLTREDIPYHYALADAFTLADHYFCSLTGPTDPNRLYLWSGTAGPGHDGTTGPFTDNSVVTGNPVADWTTYAERLHDAGVSWRVYHTPGTDPEFGDYDCNGLSYFKQFHAFAEDDPRYLDAMTAYDLSTFDAHCQAGTLPTVSWLVPPFNYCEHPEATPGYGAHYINTVLGSLTANPEIWRHSVFLVMYDENDGYFDHVVPPAPEPGTPEEFTDEGEALGLGPRVPLWVISPWSSGGYVNSQVFDHTSVLRFLELVTGVTEPNISAWRRAVCGDLTSCFDFTRPDLTLPDLPDTHALLRRADAAEALPIAPPPAVGASTMPAQEPGLRPRRPLPYAPRANAWVDDEHGEVVCDLGNDGAVPFHFTVYSHHTTPPTITPVTTAVGEIRSHRWDIRGTSGSYDISVHGADGFLRRFASGPGGAGHRVRADTRYTGLPGRGGALVTVTNDGTEGVLASYADRIVTLAPNTSHTLEADFARPDGDYDVTVRSLDGHSLDYRYAGTAHPHGAPIHQHRTKETIDVVPAEHCSDMR